MRSAGAPPLAIGLPIVGPPLLAIVALLSACAGSSSASLPMGGGSGTGAGNAKGGGSDIPGGGPGVFTGSAGTSGADAAADGPPLPPETELESTYEVPVATGHFIWVANPTSGQVAYVDAATLDVHTVAAGNGPTYVRPIPGADDAVVVLNVLSNDATVLRASGTTLGTRNVKGIPAGANAVTVSPDGHWAIAWTDATRVTQPLPTEGFQDISVIDVSAGATAASAVALTVGFRPVSISFAADSTRAFAVTSDGVSIIDLATAATPKVTRNVPLTDNPADDADTRDVTITATGTMAVIRREGAAQVGLVDLATGARTPIPLSGAVTDVDVSDSGDRAVAVVRDTAEVAILPLASGVPAAAAVTHVTIAGETVGSVSLTSDGKTALLYSNSAPFDRMTVLTLSAATPSYHVLKLHAPVLSVFPTADGQSAVVLHANGPPPGQASTGPDAGAPPALSAANAFSLVPLSGDLPARIQSTPARPLSVALAPTSDRALVTVRDDGQRIFDVYLGFMSTLEVQQISLASPPLAAGIITGAGRGYVAQQHPEGRITFVALDGSEARTLTGFELGAGVVTWGQP